jgi:hypothetical protein
MIIFSTHLHREFMIRNKNTRRPEYRKHTNTENLISSITQNKVGNHLLLLPSLFCVSCREDKFRGRCNTWSGHILLPDRFPLHYWHGEFSISYQHDRNYFFLDQSVSKMSELL